MPIASTAIARALSVNEMANNYTLEDRVFAELELVRNSQETSTAQLTQLSAHVMQLDGKLAAQTENLSLLKDDFERGNLHRDRLQGDMHKIRGGMKVLIFLATSVIGLQVLDRLLPFLGGN